MDFEIEKKAYQYILENGGEVYIYTNSIRGCCGGQTAVDMEAQVELGTPVSADIDEYEKNYYQQLIVYTNKKIAQDMLAEKKMILKKVLGIFKKLVLE